MRKKICATCYFYDSENREANSDGECRRYPPTVTTWYGMSGNFNAESWNKWGFPITRGYNWCGEYHKYEEG